MAKVNTNISIDKDLKKDAQKLFSCFGLDLSTAITLFLSQAVREEKIPFEIRMVKPNEKTIEAINEVNKMEGNPNEYKSYSNVNELMEKLNKWNKKIAKKKLRFFYFISKILNACSYI